MSGRDRALEERVAGFVEHEARLLDENRLEEWYALFADDGRYWVPASADQTDPVLMPSIAYEDRLLLRVRIDRLEHPRAHSQHPPSRCAHVLQTPRVDRRDGDCWVARTPFLFVEARGERELMLCGTAWHHLLESADGFLIRLKRVDLVGAASALPMIQRFI